MKCEFLQFQAVGCPSSRLIAPQDLFSSGEVIETAGMVSYPVVAGPAATASARCEAISGAHRQSDIG